jgi:SNF2 family DNA or RNA helicase
MRNSCPDRGEWKLTKVLNSNKKRIIINRTRDTLSSGNLLSVINILMQLRKVCNHPNLFEPRPVISPMQSDGIIYYVPSLVWNIVDEILLSVSFSAFYLTNHVKINKIFL